MEITRHVRRRPGCHCCSSAYELEDEYPSVLQNRVSEEEWRVALHEINHVVHRYGPSPSLWSVIMICSMLPLLILIPVLINMDMNYNFFQVWIWIMVGQFVLWMVITISIVGRNRRFVHALETCVDEINRRWHGRAVRMRMCHHHHHGWGRNRFHTTELVVTVEGVTVVSAYQHGGVVPMPPMYGAPVAHVQQAPPNRPIGNPPPPPGYPMPPGYAPVPQGPTFQQNPPPGYEMPPPGYFEKGPAPVYETKPQDFN